MVFETDLYWL